MANTTSTQIIIDGTRNTVIKVEGVLDTSDLASFVIVSPATLQGIDNTGLVKAAKVRIAEINYNIEDTLQVTLSWDATTPLRIEQLAGRGKIAAWEYGGITNDAGAGVTGNILLATRGWVTGAILSFSVTLELLKQQT